MVFARSLTPLGTTGMSFQASSWRAAFLSGVLIGAEAVAEMDAVGWSTAWVTRAAVG